MNDSRRIRQSAIERPVTVSESINDEDVLLRQSLDLLVCRAEEYAPEREPFRGHQCSEVKLRLSRWTFVVSFCNIQQALMVIWNQGWKFGLTFAGER
jgi:hypothetical protein